MNFFTSKRHYASSKDWLRGSDEPCWQTSSFRPTYDTEDALLHPRSHKCMQNCRSYSKPNSVHGAPVGSWTPSPLFQRWSIFGHRHEVNVYRVSCGSLAPSVIHKGGRAATFAKLIRKLRAALHANSAKHCCCSAGSQDTGKVILAAAYKWFSYKLFSGIWYFACF